MTTVCQQLFIIIKKIEITFQLYLGTLFYHNYEKQNNGSVKPLLFDGNIPALLMYGSFTKKSY